MNRDLEDAEALALLADELRRRMYRFVRDARRPVTREEAASAVGISRKLAAFHLDRMVQAGLLTASYARPPGRSGPGAGRTAKHYEPSQAEFDMSLPERHYAVVGELLVDAIKGAKSGEGAKEAALRVSRERGLEVGKAVRETRRLRRPGSERALAIAQEVLADQGYEPYLESGDVLALLNCPFHSLAQRSPDLVCSMNRSYIDGILRGLGNETVEAVLECKPGDCCVTLRAERV